MQKEGTFSVHVVDNMLQQGCKWLPSSIIPIIYSIQNRQTNLQGSNKDFFAYIALFLYIVIHSCMYYSVYRLAATMYYKDQLRQYSQCSWFTCERSGVRIPVAILFVCFGFFFAFEIFSHTWRRHHYRGWTANFDVCSVVMVIEQ